MRVLQIESTFGKGSTGIISLDLMKQIEKNGGECYVACAIARSDLADSPYVYRIGNWLDHKCHALLGRIHGKQAYFSRFATRRLLRFIDRIEPDIIHFHDIHSNYVNLNMLLGYIAQMEIPLVLTLHDCWFFTGGCFHYTYAGCYKWQHACGHCPRRFQDTAAYLGDRSAIILQDRINYLGALKDLTVVGVSQWITREFEKSRIPAARLLTIHNGVDLEVFKPVKSNIRSRFRLENKFVILAPATKWLNPVNQEALQYFSSLLPSDAVMILFGCSRVVKNLPKNVIIYPFIQNPGEMAALYSASDVMVNCSHEDSLPFINLEAQACGTRVIAYSNTGAQETVDGIHSFSVPTGDYMRMFHCMMTLKEKGRASMADREELRRFVVENFDKKKNYSRYVDLYSSIINA